MPIGNLFQSALQSAENTDRDLPDNSPMRPMLESPEISTAAINSEGSQVND